MHFQPVVKRTHSLELKTPVLHPLLQIEADAAHVADNLAARFLEREILAALTAAAVASASAAAMLVLPVPAMPDRRMLLPR